MPNVYGSILDFVRNEKLRIVSAKWMKGCIGIIHADSWLVVAHNGIPFNIFITSFISPSFPPLIILYTTDA